MAQQSTLADARDAANFGIRELVSSDLAHVYAPLNCSPLDRRRVTDANKAR